MFWIYGGAFLAGDGDFWGMYDASFIVSNKDVLVVTFNYR
jgi:carboxylesterase type B